jgi:hypothetical protein
MRSFNLAPGRIGNNDRPFGDARYHACRKCGSVYWRWLNFRQRSEK